MTDKEVTRDEFYAAVGKQNVHPYIVSDKYPYTTEWKTPSGQLVGKIVPKIGAYPHLYTDTYFLRIDGWEQYR